MDVLSGLEKSTTDPEKLDGYKKISDLLKTEIIADKKTCSTFKLSYEK